MLAIYQFNLLKDNLWFMKYKIIQFYWCFDVVFNAAQHKIIKILSNNLYFSDILEIKSKIKKKKKRNQSEIFIEIRSSPKLFDDGTIFSSIFGFDPRKFSR